MDNLSEKTVFNIIETLNSQTVEQSVETQMNLPEYCSDIRKILRCFVIPNIFACGVSGDRASADAEAVVRVLYIGDGNRLECFEQSVPFSKFIEIDPAQGDLCVKVKANCEYVNCRAVSQRRISVSASIGIHFSITKIRAEKLYCDCENSQMETISEKIECSVPVALSNKIFEMSETSALAQSLAPIASVIKTHTYALIDSVKTIADKMLIKGDMVTDILYRTDSENGDTQKLSHSMPISQIIDLEGIDEESLCNVNIDILCVCVSQKSDSDGKNRLFDICVKAAACVSAYKNSELCIVADGYSTEYEVESEYKNMFFGNYIFTHKETKQLRSEFDLSSYRVSEIVDIFVLKCDGNAGASDEKIIGKGEAPIGILYKNDSGEYGYTEKTIDFSFECRGKDTDAKIIAQPVFTVTQADANITTNSKVEISMSIVISMPVFEETEKRVCVELEINENLKKPQCECPLTVYFSSPGEKLWDIARKYNTTCDTIKQDNGISCDELTEKTILLISAANS